MRKKIPLAIMFSAILIASASAQTIVITHPKSLKVASSPVLVKGAVMDFNVTEIEIAAVNLIELVRTKPEPSVRRKKPKKTSWLDTIEFESVRVRNGMFQKSFEIDEGIVSIVAKLPGAASVPENIEMKIVVYDKVSDAIEITEPEKDRAPYLKRISGVCKKSPCPKSVKITVEALVSDNSDGDSSYRIDKLLEVSVPVKNRRFTVPIAISELLTGEEIVIITVSTDGVEVTKTLF